MAAGEREEEEVPLSQCPLQIHTLTRLTSSHWAEIPKESVASHWCHGLEKKVFVWRMVISRETPRPRHPCQPHMDFWFAEAVCDYKQLTASWAVLWKVLVGWVGKQMHFSVSMQNSVRIYLLILLWPTAGSLWDWIYTYQSIKKCINQNQNYFWEIKKKW